MAKKLWNNIKHPPTSLIGLVIIAIACVMWYTGKIDATEFTIGAGVGIGLITMMGKKKEA